MSGMRRLHVTELHPNLLCILCGGYYVDATTIVECLHSFCKTCIVRYLESSKFCPICDVQVHKTKPLLSIRPDQTLQDIVYKLVPGLYQNEMRKRREFYCGHPEAVPATPEDSGSDSGRWYILPDDPVSLALHPASPPHLPSNHNTHLAARHGPHQLGAWESKLWCGAHVRYLQCPAGVSLAQLKRLIRAKFGVDSSHPIALLASTSQDPLNDALTLVDVAYITSWQKTEPMQLFYRIYERASKKIKLDLEISSSDLNICEEMPKLEPNVGEMTSSMYGQPDIPGSVSDYRSAPLLQAVGALPYRSSAMSEISVKLPRTKASTIDTEITQQPCLSPVMINTSKDKSITIRDPQVMEKCNNSTSEKTQVSVSDSGVKVEAGVSGTCAVNTVVMHQRPCTMPTNSVGVAFVPGSVGVVPCAIVPSGGCVSVGGNCIPSSANLPVSCNTTLHRQLQTGGDVHLNKWISTEAQVEGHVRSESSQVPTDISSQGKGNVGRDDDEGEEVQLKISESGVMSVCGKDTTVEGVINHLEPEACELLSKIESGTLCEDFPPVAREKTAQKRRGEAVSENKKLKTKCILVDGRKSNASKSDAKGKKNRVIEKVEKVAVPSASSPKLVEVNLDSAANSVVDGYHASNGEQKTSDSKDKAVMEVVTKTDSQRPIKVQNDPQETKEESNKNSGCSHIPASLTAASLANLNKSHFKVGLTKVLFGDDSIMEQKSSSNSLSNMSNARKEGKPELVGKTSGCRKSSQPYGYKTLKTPPKSWNPTISREQLALGSGKSSIGRGTKDLPRTNKIFKARNAPRYSDGSPEVKSLLSATVDSSETQKQELVQKLDSKTMGPQPVQKNEPSSSAPSLPSSISSLLSSLQATSPATTLGTLSNVRSVCLQSDEEKSRNLLETQKLVSKPKPPVAKDDVLPMKKATPVSQNSLSTEAKDSTNCSSKVIDNSSSVKESNTGSSFIKSIPNGRPSSSSSKTNKSAKVSSVPTTNTKSETSLGTVSKPNPKSSSGTTEIVAGSVPCLLSSSANLNQLNIAGTTVVTPCVNQVKVDTTMNTITGTTPTLQPQQHFAISSPTVGIGIIPSCTLPMPYYSSPSLGYPTYPYLYQGTETIGLIPPHTPASFIPSFPACLTPRSPLSPRSIGGAKVIQDLQPGFLPMVPLVSQVPGQAMSPQPMTPPSPRTPTSAQSPRPYPSHSPRLSCASHPSTFAPHSPKSVSSVQSSRQHTQSPKQVPALQPATSQSLKSNMNIAAPQSHLLAVSSHSDKYNLLQQNPISTTLSSSQFYMTPSASYSQNAFCQLNNSAQLSSQISAAKATSNSISLHKASIPQSTKSNNSQPGQCIMQTSSTTNIQAAPPLSAQLFQGSTAPISHFSKSLTSSTYTVSQANDSNRLAQFSIPQSTNQSLASSHSDWRSNMSKDKTGVVSSGSITPFDSPYDPTSRVAGLVPKTVPSSLPASSSGQVSSHSYRVANIPQTSIHENSIPSHGIQFSVSSNCNTVNAESKKVPIPTPSVNVSPTANVNAIVSLSNSLRQPPTPSHPNVPSCVSNVLSNSSIPLLSSISPYMLTTTPSALTSPINNVNFSCPSSDTLQPVSSKTEVAPHTSSFAPVTSEPSEKSRDNAVLPSRKPLTAGGTQAACHSSTSSAALSMHMNTTAAVTEPICTTNVLVSVGMPVVVPEPSVTVSGGTVTPRSLICTMLGGNTATGTVSSCTSALPINAKNVHCSAPSIPVSETSTKDIPSISNSFKSPSCGTTVNSDVLSGSTGSIAIYSGCTDLTAVPGKRAASMVSTPYSTSCTGLSVGSTLTSVAPSLSKENTTMQETTKCSISSPLGCIMSTSVSGRTDSTSLAKSTPETSFYGSSTVGLPYSSSTATLSQSNYIFTPSTAGGTSVMNMKERGGFEPQPSACTPVCDVMHVMDAKQQCAEPNVSSGGGPRPCLKS